MHLNVVLTSSEVIPGTLVPFTLTIDAPVVNYNAAPLQIEAGVLKINFAGTAVYDTNASKTVIPSHYVIRASSHTKENLWNC